MKTAQMLALAMLLGSIPFGYIAVYLRRAVAAHDASVGCEPTVREHSVRSIGRGHSCPRPTLFEIHSAVGMPGLVIVVLLNVAKGFAPVFIAKLVVGSIPVAIAAGAVAVLSHCFPYWRMFRPSGYGGSVAAGAALGLISSSLCRL